MTKSEAAWFIRQLEMIFDRVRLVDVPEASELSRGEDGNLRLFPCRCPRPWERESGCRGCICVEALAAAEKRTSRFEPDAGGLYYITGSCVDVDGKTFILETSSLVPGNSDRGEYGDPDRDGFRNEESYLDSVTQIYNRRYYEEQLKDLEYEAVGILDVDGFGSINRAYGFSVGDQVLHRVADELTACVRDVDGVVRYGGDEFMIIFCSIPEKSFGDRLEDIRKAVAAISLPDHPFLRITASIGGVYCAGQDPSRAVWEAGRLLCEAKLSGNCVRLKQEE